MLSRGTGLARHGAAEEEDARADVRERVPREQRLRGRALHAEGRAVVGLHLRAARSNRVSRCSTPTTVEQATEKQKREKVQKNESQQVCFTVVCGVCRVCLHK